MQGARPVTRELGVLIRNEQVFDAIEMGRRIVPIVVIAGREDVRALHPLLQHERAVRDHDARLGQLVRVLSQSGPVDRAGAGVREQARQVGRRRSQGDYDRGVVGRRDAQRVGRLFAGDDVSCILDDIDHLRVRGAGGGIHESAQRRDEVGRYDPIAI